MQELKKATIRHIARIYWKRIACTWGLVLAENVCIALIPLFMGYAIDDLLKGNWAHLSYLGMVLVFLVIISVVRRVVDTRAYGGIRVALGALVCGNGQASGVSVLNARLDMGRELVDFLEQQVPECITGVVQVVVTLVILWTFHWKLAAGAVALGMCMALTYRMFHGSFYVLNAGLNARVERQVSVLEMGGKRRLLHHLKSLRNWEVRLSDADAYLYGIVYLFLSAFIIYSLWLCSTLAGISVGGVFAIISYSWEYAEAVMVLPVTLQHLSRLGEITTRLAMAEAETA